MPKVHAQHALAGNYHLETRYAAPKWEWFVLDATRPSKTLFSGESATLRTAMKDAATRGPNPRDRELDAYWPGD